MTTRGHPYDYLDLVLASIHQELGANEANEQQNESDERALCGKNECCREIALDAKQNQAIPIEGGNAQKETEYHAGAAGDCSPFLIRNCPSYTHNRRERRIKTGLQNHKRQ